MRKLTEAEAAERYEAQRQYRRVYDMLHRREYHLRKTYYNMKRMCYNSKAKSYTNYGAKGITVCEEWRESFTEFEAWAKAHDYTPERRLVRLDKSKGYSPDNCRWAAEARREGYTITYNGETHSLSEWARIIGISRSTLTQRLDRYGWSIDKALTTPARGHNKGSEE